MASIVTLTVRRIMAPYCGFIVALIMACGITLASILDCIMALVNALLYGPYYYRPYYGLYSGLCFLL